jgi:hypothetical protein
MGHGVSIACNGLGGGETWEDAGTLYGGETLIEACWASLNAPVPADGKPFSTEVLARVLGGEYPF